MTTVTRAFCRARIAELERLLSRYPDDKDRRRLITKRIATWWRHYEKAVS